MIADAELLNKLLIISKINEEIDSIIYQMSESKNS